MKKAQYRIIHFDACDRYIGTAWNYDSAVLISTRDFATYTEARNALASECEARDVELRWFDGEYRIPRGSDLMFPASLAGGGTV